MTKALTALLVLTPILFGLVLYAVLHARKLMREAKGYERGLKMVPLLIHLPPVSDDIDSGSRDSRDVVDENVSKAQVLYNIISTTAVKQGFMNNVYGQRHLAFEIVAQNGFVYFYAAVPVALVSVVQQAIVSAYPSARVEETSDKNIFNSVGKITGTIGGELVLKENYAYPIATYQEVKRDSMQSLLSAMATLEKEDGAAVQILIRPANKTWTKNAMSIASKKRKGEDKKKSAGSHIASWSKQALMAPVKPPEESKGGSSPDKPKELSSVDQAVIDAIESKTQYPGFEVLIRVIVSSNVAQRAQAIHSNIVASFALFEAPGRNGFKHVEARNIESFVTAYIMRFFPPENNKNILNAIELATLFHFPNQDNIPTSQLQRQISKQVDGPRNMPDDGLVLGYNVFRGTKKKIVLTNEDRMRHVYIVGQTGVGKSVLLENIALQDMINGNGFAFVDPHGDTAEKLLSMVPKERTEDVVYFNPADMEYPLGLNMFEFDHPDQKDFLVQEAINMLYGLYDPGHTGIVGPRLE
ncbi:ATP-binding protein, partial [Candidatus Saccharibacteria bacterium]|nr:ATP-binding protein [Candidatus Saccharibacteria bacterium]